ncbi:MAG: late competence development ComFB family protein [Candidatus Riflebacteria bacterium]|nr:late competence development ComFB family protein [Candidatus Riflebacteria bacterium]
MESTYYFGNKEYDFSRLENMWVGLILEEIEKLLKSGEACDCEDCILDLAAISLNKLTPKYWVSGAFNAFTSPAEFSKNEKNKREAKKAVADALAMVRKNPHH